MREGKKEHARQTDQSANLSLILRTDGAVVSVPHYAEGKTVSERGCPRALASQRGRDRDLDSLISQPKSWPRHLSAVSPAHSF